MLLRRGDAKREMIAATCAWAVDCLLGEGPVWDTRRQRLFFVDIKGNALLSFDERRGGNLTPFAQGPSAVVPFQASDDLLTISRAGLDRYSPLTGTRVPIAPIEADVSGNRPNDGKCDRQGRFWFGTMDDSETGFAGSLYKVGAGGALTRMLSGIGVSNGLDWSPDGTIFYYTDSLRRTIWQFPFDTAEGALGERAPFVTLDPHEGAPDGLTVDEDGYVWSAHWDGWRIVRYNPDGVIDRVFELPVPRPTSVCFGGPDLSILYVTSARIGLSPAALERAPLSGGLFSLRPGVRGLPSRPAVMR